MAPTTAGKTSIRPLSRAERSVPLCIDSFSAAVGFMGRAYGTIRPRSPTERTNHGKEMRDLREEPAVRTQREQVEGAHEPAVPAEPADRAGPDREAARARSRLHTLPAHARGLDLT